MIPEIYEFGEDKDTKIEKPYKFRLNRMSKGYQWQIYSDDYEELKAIDAKFREDFEE